MVYQNQLLFLHSQQISSGHSSYVFAMFIYHRKGSVTGFYHDILNVIRKIISLEGDQVFLFHNVFYRNTLINQPCNGKRIQGRPDNYALITLCSLYNIMRYLCIIAYNHTTYILFNSAQMIFITVSQNHQIFLFQKLSQFIGMSRAYDYFSPDEIPMGISRHNRSLHCVGNASVLSSCIGQKVIIMGVHVRICNISCGNQSL